MKQWILVLGMLSLFVACKKKATLWDVELGAPLVNDTLDLNHLVQNQTLVPNGNGTLDLDFTKTILDIGLTDLVALPDTMVVQAFSPSLTLNVPPGFNVFNETNEHPIAIPHVQLKKIRVSGGKIQLKVFNPSQPTSSSMYSCPGFPQMAFLFKLPFRLLPEASRIPPPVKANWIYPVMKWIYVGLTAPPLIPYNLKC